MKPLVSVIIPNYNHGQYIAECIKSVVAQTYSAIEIIIIDNFSKDNTQHVVNEILNQNHSVTIKFLQFDNKGIIAASRNFGVRHSNGQYLAFLDSDDVWEPIKLERQVDTLLNSNLCAIATRFKPIGEGTYCYDHLAHMGDQGDMVVSYDDILISNSIVTSSVLMRKEYFLKLNGFDESPDYRFIEDWELWLRLSNRYGNAIIINKKLVKYRVYNRKGRDLSDDAKRCLLVIARQYNMGLISVKLYKLSRSSAYIRYAGKCLQENKKFKRLPLVKSFFYISMIRDKYRSLLFIILSFFPHDFMQVLRRNFYRFRGR